MCSPRCPRWEGENRVDKEGWGERAWRYQELVSAVSRLGSVDWSNPGFSVWKNEAGSWNELGS